MAKTKSGWKEFLELCLATKEEKSIATLFDLFFTQEEKENLAMRYLIIKSLMQKKKTQREIAKELNVSIAKITRGSNELKHLWVKLPKYLQEKLVL